MTDTLFRVEGVNVPTSQVIEALTIPHNPRMFDEVRRFGFEYEMLPSDYQGEYVDEDLDDAVSREMEDYSAWDDDHEQCNCDGCLDSRVEQERQEVYERLRRAHVGHRTGGRYDLIARAYKRGLIENDEMHDYHCDCSDCECDRSGPLMTAQGDCSCGVEFVSRIIDLDDFPITEIASWVEMMHEWSDDGNWMPDGVTSNGNHVHVSSNGDADGFYGNQQRQALGHIDAMYAIFDWSQVADGGCGKIRGYNAKPNAKRGLHSGSWLRQSGYGTFEHRLWNTPCDPRRLWAHIGLSVAIQRWAFALAEAKPEFTFWDSNEIVDTYYRESRAVIGDRTFTEVTANIGEVVRGIARYVPAFPEFDTARELITNLRPL